MPSVTEHFPYSPAVLVFVMSYYNENTFRSRVDQAMVQVKQILDNTRNPTVASDVPHEYTDKYLLAQFLTNAGLCHHPLLSSAVLHDRSLLHCMCVCYSRSGVVSVVNALEALGLDSAKLAQLVEAAKDRSVTLRLKSEETCKFLRTVVREVEAPTSYVTTWSGGDSRKHTVVTKV